MRAALKLLTELEIARLTRWTPKYQAPKPHAEEMQKYLSHKGDDVGGKRRGRACRTSHGGAQVGEGPLGYLHVKRGVFWLKFW